MEARALLGEITLIKVENVSYDRISIIDLNHYVIYMDNCASYFSALPVNNEFLGKLFSRKLKI
jgi:hypothetical protein